MVSSLNYSQLELIKTHTKKKHVNKNIIEKIYPTTLHIHKDIRQNNKKRMYEK